MKTIKILLLCFWSLAACAQTNVIYFKVGDTLSGLGSPNLKGLKVVLTDTTESPRVINGVLISPVPQSTTTKNDSKAYFTNVVWGTYNLALYSSPQVAFDIQVETNTTGLVDGASLMSITNVPNPLSEFYTKAQVDTLFSDFTAGVSLAQLLSTSNSLQSQITSGGITALVATNIINGLTGDVATNGTSLTLKFTSQGTNDIQSIAQPLVNTASNTLAVASAALGSNLTNDVNTTSNALVNASQSIANTTSNSLQTGIGALGSNLTNDVNTTSNILVAASQTIANTSSNLVLANAQTAINTSSNSVLANAQTSINTTSNSLQSQITSGGITALQATNIINGLTGVIATNGANLTLQFTSSGTNAINNLSQTIANTTSNAINSQLVSFGGVTQTNQFIITDASTNPVTTLNGGVLTNFQTVEMLLPVTSNATNYTLDVASRRKQEIVTANTNANISFSNIGTNKEIDLWVNALTSAAPCIVTWPTHVVLNHYASLTVTNGQAAYYHIDFWNGIDPTNAVITGGDYYQRQ